MAKKKREKFNNNFKVHNEEADRIRNLANDELLDFVAKQHELVRMLEKSKKTDTQIQGLKVKIAEHKVEVYDNPQLKELESKVKELKEELKDDELVQMENELREESKPLNEDVVSNKGKFNLAMEEFRTRKDKGMIKIQVGR